MKTKRHAGSRVSINVVLFDTTQWTWSTMEYQDHFGHGFCFDAVFQLPAILE